MTTLANVQMPSIDKTMSTYHEKIEEKEIEEHGFSFVICETLHFFTMTFQTISWDAIFSHHGCNEGGESPCGLMASHRCNVLN